MAALAPGHRDKRGNGVLLYLIPAHLAVTLPAGLTLGTMLGMGGRTISPRLATALLAVSLVSSVASFLNVAWITPTAYQAFRETVTGRDPTMGVAELNLVELSRRTESSVGARIWTREYARSVSMAYHRLWALSGTPLVLTLFALSVVSRRRVGRLSAGIAACMGIVSYALLVMYGSYLGRQGLMAPPLAMWLPNIGIMVASVVLLGVILGAITPMDVFRPDIASAPQCLGVS